jgi:hypothetical protein
LIGFLGFFIVDLLAEQLAAAATTMPVRSPL